MTRSHGGTYSLKPQRPENASRPEHGPRPGPAQGDGPRDTPRDSRRSSRAKNPRTQRNPTPLDAFYTRILEGMYARILGEERVREWLVGWHNRRDGFMGILDYTGIGGTETAKKYMREYGMPVRYLPDGRPRAIPWELDLWMIRFAALIEEAAIQQEKDVEDGVYARARAHYRGQFKPARHGQRDGQGRFTLNPGDGRTDA